MNIQAEKVALIREITETDSESVLQKIKGILQSAKKARKPDNTISPAMAKRLTESSQQIKEGKSAKVTLDEIWK